MAGRLAGLGRQAVVLPQFLNSPAKILFCALPVSEIVAIGKFLTAVDDSVIENVLRFGTADIGEKYLSVIRSTATEYVSGIMRRLREHEYNPELMCLYVMGGGSCLVRNFGEYDKDRVTINDDICATAKGYEVLAAHSLRKAGDPA